jgi:D-3-phosphoglycerate dehydrogenase
VARAGVGVDNINIKECANKNIVVMNAPGGNAITTAEHAIALIMSLARNIPRGTSTLKHGEWAKKKLIGVELTGKTLGIAGLGKIGKIVADRAVGLHMKVIAADPFVTVEEAKEAGAELVELDNLYKHSDFITLHVPKLPETEKMINSQTLSKMKKGVRLINCSRGEVIDLDALYNALIKKDVAGAALDVFPVEPPDYSMPIMQLDNVILTPHLGASTKDAQIKVAEMIANQMSAYLLEGKIINSVN